MKKKLNIGLFGHNSSKETFFDFEVLPDYWKKDFIKIYYYINSDKKKSNEMVITMDSWGALPENAHRRKTPTLKNPSYRFASEGHISSKLLQQSLNRPFLF